jgi:selenocysteine lyase/cysteine desulfurase
MPLPSQRHLFEMPGEIAYLNAAAYGPLPVSVRNAGREGGARKAAPWTFDRNRLEEETERLRTLAGKLVGASGDDIALVGSVSHAIATAAAALSPERGTRIVRMAGEHPSNVFAWELLGARTGAVQDVVARPADGDWTEAVLQRIQAEGPPPGVVALSPLMWTDGALVDLDRIAPAVHARGAALVIDATQAAGATPIDVQHWRPDFLAWPTYKWVLGPYRLAFLYAAPHRQGGEPLERNAFNHPAHPTGGFAAGARRYDMGERPDPAAIPTAVEALTLCLQWGTDQVAVRLRRMTDLLADAAEAQGLGMLPRNLRAANILGLQVPGGLRPGAIETLEEQGVFVAERGGVLRVSPHVYNNEGDVQMFARALGRLSGR